MGVTGNESGEDTWVPNLENLEGQTKHSFFFKEVHSMRSHLMLLNRKWHDGCFDLEQFI